MKDGLDPLASESAAYLNQLELASLNKPGEIAQRLLALSGKLGEKALTLAFPSFPESIRAPLGSLCERLLDRTVQSESINIETFAYYVVADLQRLGCAIETLTDKRELKYFVEGARKARDASSADKVFRLSQVVVTGMVSRSDPDEKVVEFIRFAADLNETDIHVLSQMYARQHTFNSKFVPQWAQEIRRAMHDRPLADSMGGFMNDQYVRSAYARLQSLGLVVALGGTASDTSPGENHYAILTLGKEFVEYLRVDPAPSDE